MRNTDERNDMTYVSSLHDLPIFAWALGGDSPAAHGHSYMDRMLDQDEQDDTMPCGCASGSCYCDDDTTECEGHPAGPFDPMGETFFCDGGCVGSSRA
jgi:hypothetical protein